VHSRWIYAVACGVLIVGASLAIAGTKSWLGPLASHTGAAAVASKPREDDCSLCHFNFDWNNLNTPGGGVEIIGLPQNYDAGQTYPITIRIYSDSTVASPTRKWGFQLTAARASDGEGCGTFILSDPDTLQIVLGDPGPFYSRAYVEHTYMGTRDGLFGPVEWRLSWQAPDPAEGTIYFFCAGNAADGTQDPGFDFIYTAADTVEDPPTAVKATSWGSIKSRYR
jgi:hypothetical protein